MTQIDALIARLESTDQGTVGVLITKKGNVFYTMEPPWRDNKRNESCIPTGLYTGYWRKSPRFGWCYALATDGIDRDYILIHSGNYGGDKSKGFLSNTSGCILVGSRVGTANNQRAVLSSRPAINKLFGSFRGANITIRITDYA